MIRLVKNLRPVRWLVIGLVLAVGVLIAARRSGDAQGDFLCFFTPIVTAIDYVATANSVAVTVDFDRPEGLAQMQYGLTTNYDSYSPPSGYQQLDALKRLHFTASGLSANTTYNFRIKTLPPSFDPNCARYTSNRTFTTRSGGAGGGGTISINDVSVECLGGNCRITYSTSHNANVQIRYDFASHADFNSYAFGPVSEPAGFYSSALRSLDLTGLNLGTLYHYRIQANAASVPPLPRTTEDFTFTTGAGSGDRTFTTGACAGPGGVSVPIGGCSPDGGYCEPGGNLVYRCDTICSYSCPAGETCRVGGSCEADPSADSPYQCNAPECYNPNGGFISIDAAAGCYASWPRCTANTVLKVRKDRACNLWLSCATSLPSEPLNGQPAGDLCLSLGACNKLNAAGQCGKFQPQGQCYNDPLRFCSDDTDCLAGDSCIIAGAGGGGLRNVTYDTPMSVARIADLSGNVVAGLNWNLPNPSGPPTITGLLPWQLMPQLGATTTLENGDLEYSPQDLKNWQSAPVNAPIFPSAGLKIEFEDRDRLTNHVLEVEPAVVPSDPAISVPFTGAAFGPFPAQAGEAYFAEVRVKTKTGSFPLAFQFGHSDYTQFEFAGLQANTGWQRVRLGPVSGLSGQTWLAVVCADSQAVNCGPFQIDDVKVGPVLQINTDPRYVAPSCRMYPKEDAPACSYLDVNGVAYKGWRGYCLEHDSVTGTCLSWWPVDLIKGQSDIFGTEQQAGYADRAPLYVCGETAGNAWAKSCELNRSRRCNTDADCAGAGVCTSRSSVWPNRDYHDPEPYRLTVPTWLWDDQPEFTSHPARGPDQSLTEADIYAIHFGAVGDHGWDNRHFTFLNDEAFQASSPGSPVISQMPYGRGSRNFFDMYRAVYPNGDVHWNLWSTCFSYEGQLYNCTAQLTAVFSGATGKLVEYRLYAFDTTGSAAEAIYYEVHLHLREPCRTIIEVVDPGGHGQVFASRIGSSQYSVPNLGYGLAADFTPFGGVVAPDEPDPAKWPVLEAQTDSGAFEFPGQARSGAPYACVGQCNGYLCRATAVTNWEANERPVNFSDPWVRRLNTPNNFCRNPDEVRRCQGTDIDDDGRVDDDRAACIGVNPPELQGPKESNPGPSAKGIQRIGPHNPANVGPGHDDYFGQERLRRLFAKSNKVYQLGLDSGWPRQWSYRYVPTSAWPAPSMRCPAPDPAKPTEYKRPGFADDFCGVPPKIMCPDQDACSAFGGLAQFVNNTGSQATVTGGSGSVTIKFLTDADVDQVPLQNITIDWGDKTDVLDFPYAPRNNPARPHIAQHNYVINPASPDCVRPPGGLKPVCNYSIKIQVKDAWGWCNTAEAGNACPPPPAPQTVDTGLRVRVEP